MCYYCLKCRKNSESITRFSKTNNGKTMILSNYGSKKPRFIKRQEARGIQVVYVLKNH